MSIRHRLINLARAELNGLLDRVGQHLPRGRPVEDEEPNAQPRQAKDDPHAQQIRQFYINLELQPGANWPSVKRAYRRMMRQYHPDRHHSDPDKERLANELSQKLRDAYDGLKKELNEDH